MTGRNDDDMTTEAAFSDLAWQNAVIEAAFMDAGFEAVEPPILQPAEFFLDRSGEDIRSRMFVFADPGGQEVCLRPDLTIPTCRLYLDSAGRTAKPARLCYSGVAFRYQGRASDRPAEFIQTGIEHFGARDKEKADAEALSLIVEACARAGLSDYKITIGDVGLFFALIDALDIPQAWRSRLAHSIWHAGEFDQLLKHFSRKDKNGCEGSALLAALAGLDEVEARAAIMDVMNLARISAVGERSVEEITERLLAQAVDARAEPLSPVIVKLLNDYSKVSGKPAAALNRIRTLTKSAKVDIGKAIEFFERRLELIEAAGVPKSKLRFDADFGRNLEYYTGFVFEILVPSLGKDAQIAGGGRYDTLLRQLGAARDIPAVGAMIRTERLLAALGGEA